MSHPASITVKACSAESATAYAHTDSIGQLLRELRHDRRSYFGHLTYHLALLSFSMVVDFFTSGRGSR